MEPAAGKDGVTQRRIRERAVRPHEHLVLERDPAQLSLRTAFGYVLRVRTNVILIITSALGYFYFAGVQTFALVYFRGHYGIAHATALLVLVLLGAGALAGVLAGGRLADRLVRDGRVNGRILVGGASYLLAAVFFLPALASRSLAMSLPLYLLAAGALAARNPPLDAARLDIMHPRLWGRAEAIRTLLRPGAVATEPVIFGLLADALAHGHASAGAQHGLAAGVNARGLQYAFMILLFTLAAGGLLTVGALRTYPRDVATATAFAERTAAAT